jgi:hypothetical protein
MSSTEPMGGENKTSESVLADEVREFGRQLSAVIRSVRESPRAREIEQQVTQAMRDVEKQVNEALGTAREKTQAQDIKETIKGTATMAADEMQRGLAKGLHALNERMAKALHDAENARKSEGMGSSQSDGGTT